MSHKFSKQKDTLVIVATLIWYVPLVLAASRTSFIRSLPAGVQLSAAAYGVPAGQNSNSSSGVTAAAGQLTSQQAALAAQGAALAQQQAGVMMQAAAYPASAVQQFQVNGQPTTIAL